jgi:alpha-tubulin suppressor-like RCC1 family protein
MVLDKDGYLWASGSNGYGQIGNGKCGDYEFNYDISTFEKIGDAKWKFICASSFNSAGIQEDGTLWIWGANTYGQLGQPSVSTYGGVYTPSKVNDAQWKQIRGRSSTYCAIQNDGTLWTWGNNWDYATGHGADYEYVDMPIQLGTDRWLDAASGFYHSAGIKADGTLWAWGENERKQVADTEETVYYEPTQVGTDNDWVALGTGVSSTAALKADGSLWTWGSNNEGELGREIEGEFSGTPGKAIENVKSFSVGDYHILVIKEDGSVWVWGWNRYGQLGMGDTDSRSVPTEFGGLSSVNSVVANTTAKVFPTVASETITISDEASLNVVYVYGANGSFVAKKENINSNATTLNVSALANGVYFVKVASENGESVQKFIKK